MPIITGYLLTTLNYMDVEEYAYNNVTPTCKQTFIYINRTTHQTLNIFSCLITYIIIFINFILIIKIKLSIKLYKRNSLRGLTEAAMKARNEAALTEQVIFIIFYLKLY
jgi:hypothetical protein